MKRSRKLISALMATMLMFTSGFGMEKAFANAQIAAPNTAKELRVGIIANKSMEGKFLPYLYNSNLDSQILSQTVLGAFDKDDDGKINNNGPITVTLNLEEKKAHIVIKDNLKWSNGKPVTANDILFTYMLLGHPLFDSIHYTSDMNNIIGMVQYHKGEAKAISGIRVIDAKNVQISYNKLDSNMLWGNKGFLTEFLPEGHLKKIPVKQLANNTNIYVNAPSYGPFVLQQFNGKMAKFKANPYYWKGNVQIDSLRFQIVNENEAIKLMEQGKLDMIMPFSPNKNLQERFEKMGNASTFLVPSATFNYLGFKLGKWDKEERQNVPDAAMTMADANLRKAMVQAVDFEKISQQYFGKGLVASSSLYTEKFGNLHSNNPNGLKLDVQKAKQTLDSAGYRDKNGDGLREKPDGQDLRIQFLSVTATEEQKSAADAYIKAWRNVGLNVNYVVTDKVSFGYYLNGLMEDAEVDVFYGAWDMGSSPDAHELLGRDSLFNFSRFASKELDQMVVNAHSFYAFDEGYRVSANRVLEEYLYAQAPIVPVLERKNIFVLSNRVQADENSIRQVRIADMQIA